MKSKSKLILLLIIFIQASCTWWNTTTLISQSNYYFRFDPETIIYQIKRSEENLINEIDGFPDDINSFPKFDFTRDEFELIASTIFSSFINEHDMKYDFKMHKKLISVDCSGLKISPQFSEPHYYYYALDYKSQENSLFELGISIKNTGFIFLSFDEYKSDRTSIPFITNENVTLSEEDVISLANEFGGNEALKKFIDEDCMVDLILSTDGQNENRSTWKIFFRFDISETISMPIVYEISIDGKTGEIINTIDHSK